MLNMTASELRVDKNTIRETINQQVGSQVLWYFNFALRWLCSFIWLSMNLSTYLFSGLVEFKVEQI